MALVVRDVQIVRGGRTLLDNISLTLERGEVVGLLGPNGAGKTTLLRAISGEDLPDRGTIEYDGVCTRTLNAAQLAAFRSLVPQSQGAAFNYTTREVLELGVAPEEAVHANTHIAAIADELGLSDLLGRIAANLSGGEMQRVRIGRALLQLQTMRAPYLLLDEPTSAQDPGRAALLAELFKLRAIEHNIGVVVIVHDLNLAARLCDRLLLLKDGQMIMRGTPHEVLTQDIVYDAFGPGLQVFHTADSPPTILPQPHNTRAAVSNDGA